MVKGCSSKRIDSEDWESKLRNPRLKQCSQPLFHPHPALVLPELSQEGNSVQQSLPQLQSWPAGPRQCPGTHRRQEYPWLHAWVGCSRQSLRSNLLPSAGVRCKEGVDPTFPGSWEPPRRLSQQLRARKIPKMQLGVRKASSARASFTETKSCHSLFVLLQHLGKDHSGDCTCEPGCALGAVRGVLPASGGAGKSLLVQSPARHRGTPCSPRAPILTIDHGINVGLTVGRLVFNL